MKRVNNELMILHISDLHFGKFNPHTGELEFFKKIWEKIQEKLSKRKINLTNIDIVVVTGDISSKGSKTDFKYAKEFFKEVLNQLIDKRRFIIIPGNHDMNGLTMKVNLTPIGFKIISTLNKI